MQTLKFHIFSGLLVSFLVLGTVSSRFAAPGRDNLPPRYAYGGGDCGSVQGIPNIDNYIKWRMTNFSTWVDEDGRFNDTLLLVNSSDSNVSNHLFTANVTFTDTTITGLLEKIEPHCVKVDLERGRINVAISHFNTTLKGQYNVNGTLLESLNISGDIDWEMGCDIKCTLETSFAFNTTTKKMKLKGRDPNEFRDYAHCGVQHGSYNSYPTTRVGYYTREGQRYGGSDSGSSTSQKFEGSLGSIPEVLQKEIKRVLAAQVMPDMHYTLFLPITDNFRAVISDYLSTILQEKTIFDMLDFDWDGQKAKDEVPVTEY